MRRDEVEMSRSEARGDEAIGGDVAPCERDSFREATIQENNFR